MKKLRFNILIEKSFLIVIAMLILITILTSYYGSIDIGDYADVAKFFAGKYSADIRGSHSYLYGYLHSPLVYIFGSFFIFKITSLIFLILIIYSVYSITGKSKRSSWLILLSPAVWYIAPWINPIQLASLFLLWGWYFIVRYNKYLKIKSLLYSGIFLGLGLAVWDTILFIIIFLIIPFLFDKKVSHLFYFFIFILIGLVPRLILDQLLFNFPFYTIIKSSLGTIANIFGGIYGSSGHTPKNIINLISVFLAIPLCFWSLFRVSYFVQHKRSILFLSLSLILILTNPQIRYVLSLVPIMIVLLSNHINKKQFKVQIIFSLIISLVFIMPYIIQINNGIGSSVKGIEFTSFLDNISNFSLSKESPSELIKQDIEEIVLKFPNETFIVGNSPDDYALLARIYWGNKVNEFVSIQDYELWVNNESVLFEKRFEPISNINDRRTFWISGGIGKNENDSTDYENIEYGIGINEPINIKGFIAIKKYNILHLSKKANIIILA